MTLFTILQEQLGLMTWPLIICSVLTLMIISERLLKLISSGSLSKKEIIKILEHHDPKQPEKLQSLSIRLKTEKNLAKRGMSMLFAHQHFSQQLREDTASIWVQDKRQELRSGLKMLALIGMISPLLGLLGTVLGLIEMFKAIALTTGSVTPNDLADGLGIAMRTTAAGLLVALPAICGAQLLGLWADKVTYRLEFTLNFCNLWLQGVDFPDQKRAPKPKSTSQEVRS
ncbi:MotA/TolQ/ExbB proton channel family protein [Psychromonas sp. 14N.309.X.WAT.B.A12]|uniref:MotA/TolQ/ExbB proton channel family protein n=1 Tax=unclassified Psychromonas TaxID=2614957 RepID=UPI0025B1FB40|nr:MotA/TolQ/ExbB proton channel family protein [Psychromonas sp. 14N.309.X.WAT.B.A12]MDN2664807.1 MotA/TolQ/ExbB proton channel family protein [Psychromonas sp. 14N.309.X.WAT.B.A12]